MKTVNKLLETKGNEIWSVRPTDSVFDAITAMATKGVGALLVMDGGELRGIVSERDYARKVILQGKSSKNTTVAEIMTSRVTCIEPTSSVHDAMAIMTDKRIRHLPVVVDGKVTGVISIGDVVREVISEQSFHIEQLEKYIQGG